MRTSALAALLDIRPLGGDAVRALLSAVTDPSSTISEIARMVIYAQHSSGFIGQDAVPALVDALRGPNAAIRRAAMTLLANLGPLARDAAPALRDLATRDPDPEVRDGANEVLKLIDSN